MKRITMDDITALLAATAQPGGPKGFTVDDYAQRAGITRHQAQVKVRELFRAGTITCVGARPTLSPLGHATGRLPVYRVSR